ncbi:MAG: T9SS type A sorting domain-containing protein [Bacteroidales bacterium]|nr:T9SS type A sorting domain-containing protein [Bacteroidales bacterium]
MLKKVLLVIVALLLGFAASAQSRFITRGAEEGELYMSATWYCNYGIWGDTLYNALLHITENGKKVEINHSVEYQSPDAGTADDLPMQLHYVMADATPGVLYIADWYMTYQAMENTRLWFSDDYGKNWELRDNQIGRSYYYSTNNEGVIYRGGGGVYKSVNFALDFFKEEGISYWVPCDPGLLLGEVFSAGAMNPYQGKLTHTYNDFKTYTQMSIDSQYMFGQVSGLFPDVFRGGLLGEVYITSGFPDNTFKVSFSADTGYNFRVVHQRDGAKTFMTDRKAGDFYIVTGKAIETQEPWGWYARLCFEYYTDYGETLVDIYCHDLTREGVVTAVGEMDVANGHIIIYPNPTDGIFYVETHNYASVRNIDVFDLMGRNVLTVPVETHGRASLQQQPTTTIDISLLPTGMYFVWIQTENGVVTRKVVKK